MPNYWNPWHGCKKISEGCRNCYVYRQDAMYGIPANARQVKKNETSFDMPIRLKRDGGYQMRGGQMIYTCLTSDFFIEQADEYRRYAWEMIKMRPDLRFFIFTKRINRIASCLPDDWNDGYKNVYIACSVENQASADERLPEFLQLSIPHKIIAVAPILEQVDLRKYLSKNVEYVAASGESGFHARPCDFDWILNLRTQCVRKCIPFEFHQTGENFIRNQRRYKIDRNMQIAQARKADVDYKPDGVDYCGCQTDEPPHLF